MNSDTIWFPETNEKEILYIVKNMKKSVFAGLDRHKEEAKKIDTNTKYSSGYDDSKWRCSNIDRDLSNCQYSYVYKDSCGWNVDIDYRPFDAYSYESGSAERKLVETFCRGWRDEAITKAVMTRLLNEWKRKEKQKEDITETNEQKIAQIIMVLRPHVIQELDLRKAKLQQDPDYDDSKWNYEASRSLDNCTFHYSNKSMLLGDVYWYHPFRLENYEVGSAEYDLIENIRHEDDLDSIKEAAMARLLGEWKEREERIRRKKRIRTNPAHPSTVGRK